MLVLMAAISGVCTLPYVLGQSSADPRSDATRATAVTPEVTSFAVATVKPTDPKDRRWRLGFTVEGYSAENVALLKIIQDAYGIYEDDRIDGGPEWMKTQRFSLEAKVDVTDMGAFTHTPVDQRMRMLQSLLAERFDLVVHVEKMERPIYALVIAKGGPRLKQAAPEHLADGSFKGYRGTILVAGPGHRTFQGFSMANFAQMLSRQVGRHVDDKTGLTGYYDFTLDWTPDNPAVSQEDAPKGTPVSPDFSIYPAIKEQLGLELKSEKGPVDVLVIDHVDAPSPN